jgi:hypothetical protein
MSFKFSVALAVILCVLGGFLFLQRNNSDIQNQIIIDIENNLMPIVLENNLSYYLNTDSCRALTHNGRTVRVQLGSTQDTNCQQTGDTFSQEDKVLFNRIETRIAENNLNIYKISEEHPISYRSEHATIPNQSYGLSFSLDCEWCGTRYLYAPGNMPLIDIPQEISYEAISNSWYRVQQDPL